MTNPDVTYTNIRYFLNPKSQVPLAVAEQKFNNGIWTYLIPCDNKLVRITRLFIEHPTGYEVYFKTGNLFNDRIVYSRDEFSYLPSSIDIGALVWYKQLSLDSIEEGFKKSPIDFEFTEDRHGYLSGICEHYLPPAKCLHYEEIVNNYLKAFIGSE